MIVITAQPGRITITGHAGYAPRGQDIVCAGVSVLVETLAASLEELTKDKFIYEAQPGQAVLEYGILSAGGALLVESFFVGAGAIARTYPDCVEVIHQNENSIGRECR